MLGIMNLDRIPSLNWLRVFVAAARAESFVVAGRALHLSAPAVSQQIKALESHLGVDLFVRHARSVVLSDQGRAWLPAVEHALVSLETATDGLFGPRQQSSLHVRALLLFALGYLSGRVPDFESAHPAIRLHLSTTNRAADEEASEPGLQIVFGSPAAFADRADLLFGERLYPVASPQIAERIQSAADLAEHTLHEVATHRAGWLPFLDGVGVTVPPTRFLYTDSTVFSFSLASAGTGVALARAPASDRLEAQMGLVPCLNQSVPGVQHYYLLRNEPGAISPAASAFRTWLLDETAPLRT